MILAVPDGSGGYVEVPAIRGAQGLPGAPGPAGPEGPQGPRGTQGPSGPPGVRVSTARPPNNEVWINPGATGNQSVLLVPDGDGGYTGIDAIRGEKGEQGPPGTPAWEAVTDKPSTFPPETHLHSASDITGPATAGLDVSEATVNTNGELGPGSVVSRLDALDGRTIDANSEISNRIRRAGTAETIWLGDQSQYNALSASTKNAVGFIAVILE